MIALGEVVDSRAYLSHDKTGVYSEFTIRLGEVFKNDSLSPLAPGDSVTAERWGGRVRFPSGRIIRYGNSGEDMPRQGRRYVFFLVGDSQRYSILTAYELRAGRIYPLDGKNAPGYKGSDWAGDAYEGTDATLFLIEVQNAVAQSSPEVKGKEATLQRWVSLSNGTQRPPGSTGLRVSPFSTLIGSNIGLTGGARMSDATGSTQSRKIQVRRTER